jgi:hypothetical protein
VQKIIQGNNWTTDEMVAEIVKAAGARTNAANSTGNGEKTLKR